MLENFKFDFWTLFGLTGQFVFLLRFVVQWIASERAKASVLPVSFWYLSLIGAFMLLIYAWKRQDLVFFLSFTLSIFIYFRNLSLHKKSKTV